MKSRMNCIALRLTLLAVFCSTIAQNNTESQVDYIEGQTIAPLSFQTIQGNDSQAAIKISDDISSATETYVQMKRARPARKRQRKSNSDEYNTGQAHNDMNMNLDNDHNNDTAGVPDGYGIYDYGYDNGNRNGDDFRKRSRRKSSRRKPSQRTESPDDYDRHDDRPNGIRGRNYGLMDMVMTPEEEWNGGDRYSNQLRSSSRHRRGDRYDSRRYHDSYDPYDSWSPNGFRDRFSGLRPKGGFDGHGSFKIGSFPITAKGGVTTFHYPHHDDDRDAGRRRDHYDMTDRHRRSGSY